MNYDYQKQNFRKIINNKYIKNYNSTLFKIFIIYLINR